MKIIGIKPELRVYGIFKVDLSTFGAIIGGKKKIFLFIRFLGIWGRENLVVWYVNLEKNNSPFTIYIGHLFFGYFTVEGQA